MPSTRLRLTRCYSPDTHMPKTSKDPNQAAWAAALIIRDQPPPKCTARLCGDHHDGSVSAFAVSTHHLAITFVFILRDDGLPCMHVLLIPTVAVCVPDNSTIVDLTRGGRSKAMHRVIFLGSSHYAADHVPLGVACSQCRTLAPRQFTEASRHGLRCLCVRRPMRLTPGRNEKPL